MAWRPTPHLIEGELDNTCPGKVTGWLRFAGLTDRVTLDLTGDFHRDIRGAKIHLRGKGDPANPDATNMEGFALTQTGQAGDITAGLPPQDYSKSPYVEWYSDENGRVVLELGSDQIAVIGRPIPAIESDPISRQVQDGHMRRFAEQIGQAMGVPVTVVRSGGPPDDPAYSHWLIEDGAVVGEARAVEGVDADRVRAQVRRFDHPTIESATLPREHVMPKRGR